MSFFKEFQCCNPSNIILPKDITCSAVPDEQKNLNNSDIIVNDEYVEIPYFIKIDPFIQPNQTQIKIISCTDSLNTSFLSSEVPINLEITEQNITKSSSIEFSTLKIEQRKSKKLSTQITKMRKFLLNNSF
jgi:hypothetical protein